MLFSPINSYQKDFCALIGVDVDEPPINGNWLQTAAIFLGATESVNGNWIQTIAHCYDIYETINGSWIQAIAQIKFRCTETVNGSWWYAIITSPSNTKFILSALSTRIGIDLTSDRCLTGYLNTLTNNYIYSNISTQLKLRLEADDIFISDMDCINSYLKNNITNE